MQLLKKIITQFPLNEFIKFCIVGSTGVIVDMGFIWLLADPRMLGLNVSISKGIAAEIALISNFFLNNFWTFKNRREEIEGVKIITKRLIKFNAICGIGIILGILLINLFYKTLGLNLYLSNLLAIGIVTIWNFGLNIKYNWIKDDKNRQP
ncbi:MAG: GtrA family protein [Sulfolobaceae archaeon]